MRASKNVIPGTIAFSYREGKKESTGSSAEKMGGVKHTRRETHGVPPNVLKYNTRAE